MFTMTLEESKNLQDHYQRQAQAWRERRELTERTPTSKIIMLALANLMIHSGNQLKQRLQPA